MWRDGKAPSLKCRGIFVLEVRCAPECVSDAAAKCSVRLRCRHWRQRGGTFRSIRRAVIAYDLGAPSRDASFANLEVVIEDLMAANANFKVVSRKAFHYAIEVPGQLLTWDDWRRDQTVFHRMAATQQRRRRVRSSLQQNDARAEKASCRTSKRSAAFRASEYNGHFGPYIERVPAVRLEKGNRQRCSGVARHTCKCRAAVRLTSEWLANKKTQDYGWHHDPARAEALGPPSLMVSDTAKCAGLARPGRITVFLAAIGSSGLVVVGEAPGADGDATGTPFVGSSGRVLDRR